MRKMEVVGMRFELIGREMGVKVSRVVWLSIRM